MCETEIIAKSAISHFVNSLISESGWICLHNKIENYNISEFSQKTDVVKYCLEMNNSKIKTVILSEKKDGMKTDVALEVIFSNKPDYVFLLPLSDANKETLRETLAVIRKQQENTLYQDITENFPR